MTKNADWSWISQYAPDTTVIKDVPITYPMLYDSLMIEDSVAVGLTFEAYEIDDANLPSIFLIDQVGLLHLREEGAADFNHFFGDPNDPEDTGVFGEIISTIEDLLDNPPDGW